MEFGNNGNNSNKRKYEYSIEDCKKWETRQVIRLATRNYKMGESIAFNKSILAKKAMETYNVFIENYRNQYGDELYRLFDVDIADEAACRNYYESLYFQAFKHINGAISEYENVIELRCKVACIIDNIDGGHSNAISVIRHELDNALAYKAYLMNNAYLVDNLGVVHFRDVFRFATKVGRKRGFEIEQRSIRCY